MYGQAFVMLIDNTATLYQLRSIAAQPQDPSHCSLRSVDLDTLVAELSHRSHNWTVALPFLHGEHRLLLSFGLPDQNMQPLGQKLTSLGLYMLLISHRTFASSRAVTLRPSTASWRVRVPTRTTTPRLSTLSVSSPSTVEPVWERGTRHDKVMLFGYLAVSSVWLFSGQWIVSSVIGNEKHGSRFFACFPKNTPRAAMHTATDTFFTEVR